MKKLLAILSVVLFANQAIAEDNTELLDDITASKLWACAGWDDEEIPDPFMLGGVARTGAFAMSNTDDKYRLHSDYLHEFFKENDDMTVIAYLIDRGSGDLDKSQALILTQDNRRLEAIRIYNIHFSTDPFRNTDRTYCNEIE